MRPVCDELVTVAFEVTGSTADAGISSIRTPVAGAARAVTVPGLPSVVRPGSSTEMFDAVPVVMTRSTQPVGPICPAEIVSEAVGVIGVGVVPVATIDCELSAAIGGSPFNVVRRSAEVNLAPGRYGARMTSQPESRWSLDHTGNRVLLAVVVGLVVSFIGRQADITHGAADVLLFAIAAVVTYVLVTKLRR